MSSPEESTLWRTSLGSDSSFDEDSEFRDRLIAALTVTEERTSELAQEIARDLPEFTVHDSSHAQALWGLASQIAGPEIFLTPVEAFVFGTATMIHDLGMASAAYVDGPQTIEEEPRWSDTVSSVLRQKHGRVPTASELEAPGPEVIDLVKARILRNLHAQQAERLASATWTDSRGAQFALMEDTALRGALGPLIGQLAHSHWWTASRLPERFREEIGAPAGAPASWTVRPLLLACLLRLADAAHLDASRAPRFLRLLRSPAAEAGRHWEFQAHLSQPVPKGDRLLFSGTPFSAEEAESWWLCADTLAAVDKEFRAVDSVLADEGQPRFAIKGLLGVDNPQVLERHIPADGWSPIDAKVRVSNVVRLVERLGGRELYGSRPDIPLRELIQNGTDAIRARRVVDELDAKTGTVTVTVEASGQEGFQWLRVEDTGVGMSKDVLTEHLLDFGLSFWESETIAEEFPGLLSGGFEPVGRFGIGFFSVFMWGNDVDVVSRRLEAARADTWVLEFRGGVARRPLLRLAEPGEQMKDHGTRVRVLLEDETIWRLGLDPGAEDEALRRLCAWLAPASEVTILTGPSKLRAVEAGDWLDLPLDELEQRITDSPLRVSDPYPPAAPEDEAAGDEEAENEASAELREAFERRSEQEREAREARAARVRETARALIDGQGRCVGRLSIAGGPASEGVTVVGGLRATTLSRVTGILQANPTTASRNGGLPTVSAEELARWASEQAELLQGAEPSAGLEYAGLVWTCGGETGELPIAVTAAGHLSRAAMVEWASDRETIAVLHDAALWNDEHAYGEVELLENVVAVGSSADYMVYGSITGADPAVSRWPLTDDWQHTYVERSLLGAVAAAVGKAWNLPSAQLLRMYYDRSEPVIGLREGKPVSLEAPTWRRRDPEQPSPKPS